MRRINTIEDALNTSEAEISHGDGLTSRIALGKQRYTIDETAGRVIRVWDYKNNREQLIYGDSGWRDVKALMPAGITATGFVIRRVGFQVIVAMQALRSTTAGNITILTAPAGFTPGQPTGIALRTGLVSTLDGATVRMTSPFNTVLRILSMTADTSFEGEFSYYTSEAWPTTLPGTAAGSAS